MPKRGTKGKARNKVNSRFEKWAGGAVPSAGRTSEQQLAHLDAMGFVATKERAKIKRRLEVAAKASQPKKGKKNDERRKAEKA